MFKAFLIFLAISVTRRGLLGVLQASITPCWKVESHSSSSSFPWWVWKFSRDRHRIHHYNTGSHNSLHPSWDNPFICKFSCNMTGGKTVNIKSHSFCNTAGRFPMLCYTAVKYEKSQAFPTSLPSVSHSLYYWMQDLIFTQGCPPFMTLRVKSQGLCSHFECKVSLVRGCLCKSVELS